MRHASRIAIVVHYRLADADEFDVEKECGIGWDVGWTTHRAVRQIAGNRKLPFATDFHRHQALVPALDHAADADGKFRRRLACGTVELGAVFQCAYVIDDDSLPHFGTWPIADFQVEVFQSRRRNDLRARRVRAPRDDVNDRRTS